MILNPAALLRWVSCYISTGFGDKGRTWAIKDPIPARWGLKGVNLGSTRSEILKNLRTGDLLIWSGKGVAHAGVFIDINGTPGLLHSHGKFEGPEMQPDFNNYWLNGKKHPEIPIPKVYRSIKIMKLLSLSFLLYLTVIAANAQSFPVKQLTIPLDNKVGVPFYFDKEINNTYISGFEVDEKENYYFLGGNEGSILAVFNGSEQIYRKINKQLSEGASQLYFYNGKLYAFSRISETLFVLDASNGIILKTFAKFVHENLTGFRFFKGSLIAQISYFNHEKYTLEGAFVKKIDNEYDLPPALTKITKSKTFLGEWKGNFVCWAYDEKSNADIYYLVDKMGKTIMSKRIPHNIKIYGDVFAEEPDYHKVLRNESIYILNRKGKSALITKIPLKTFFTP